MSDPYDPDEKFELDEEPGNALRRLLGADDPDEEEAAS
jgi:hypothetical protein